MEDGTKLSDHRDSEDITFLQFCVLACSPHVKLLNVSPLLADFVALIVNEHCHL